MSEHNPTPLRIGATGTLDGWRVRVAGRAVMGMEDGGETYYWNEFNLVDGFGRSATLVYEETDDGPEWKLFKEFTPLRPLSVAEAERKRVGDAVNLDGTAARITLVDQSRVYHVEGTLAEGVAVDIVANYFNVDTGEGMLVASWTGDEIEYYEGQTVPAAKVAEAFGFPATAPREHLTPQLARPQAPSMLKFVGVAVAAIAFVTFFTRGQWRPPVATRTMTQTQPGAITRLAPAPKLAVGAQGIVDQATYTIAARAMLDIAQDTGPFEWEEYSLVSGTGERALLVRGLTRISNEWHLLLPVAPTGPLAQLTPFDAAGLRQRTLVDAGDRQFVVWSVFRVKPRAVEGNEGPAIWPPVEYGFLAKAGSDYLVARWTESGIQFFRDAARLRTPAVMAGFGPGPESAP